MAIAIVAHMYGTGLGYDFEDLYTYPVSLHGNRLLQYNYYIL